MAKVHRPLTVGLKGDDVVAFQRAINAALNHYKIDHRVAVDGVYGRKTHRAGRQVARAMGCTATAWSKMLRGRMPQGAQKLVRQQRPRTRAERLAHGRRGAYRKALRTRYRTPPGPKIYTGIVSPSAVFGGLGTPYICAGHYTAGPVDTSDAHAIALDRQYDSYHRGLGWGGLAYHYNITREGNIVCGRPVRDKGAHVGGHNSNNVGIMMHGTTGDRPTEAQQETLRWLLDNAHTGKMPTAHRSPRRLRDLALKGHYEFPGNATSCPGLFIDLYRSKGATR